MMKKLIASFAVILLAASSANADLFDQNVTPEVIFGSGNANGSFTVERMNGVELGLRGKLRHNSSGLAENTFNSNGDGTYSFNAGVAPTQSSPTAEWSFEWSINSNFDGTSGWNLVDLTYELSMMSVDTGSMIPIFDPINDGTYWDHAIGTNATGNGGGTVAADDTDYANLIAANNVAQNSWKPHWFASPFDPTLAGDYIFTLTAYNGNTQVASTSMTVQVVPEPATISLFGLAGLALVVRRRRR